MIILEANKLQKHYGAYSVLEDVSFDVREGERVGVIGGNGAGKTTLMRLISRQEEPEGGQLFFRKGLTFAYLEQVPVRAENYTVDEVLREAFAPLKQLKLQIDGLHKKITDAGASAPEFMLKEFGALQHRYEQEGGYEIEPKIDTVVNGLKIPQEFLPHPFARLSGGEKTRVLLAKCLLAAPEMLLLDEPTNHLDLDSIEWLEMFLGAYRGSVAVISHDRYFLDRVCTKIVEIERGKSTVYSGNYSAYENRKNELLEESLHKYKHEQAALFKMQESIRRLNDYGKAGGGEKMHKRAQSMQKRLDKMAFMDKPVTKRQTVLLKLDASGRTGNEVLIAEKVRKAFGGKTVLDGISFLLKHQERMCIIGKNGCGKSTLLKLILNKMQADGGLIKSGANVKAGYLEQEVRFDDMEQTVLACYGAMCGIGDNEAKEQLSRFLFRGDSLEKKLKSLSGGELARLKLAQLMYSDVNFLILDEPTNHLDIETREVLESVLSSYTGTLLFVSHDRYFINRLATRLCELDGGKFTEYSGNYDDYKAEKQRRFAEQIKPVQAKTAEPKQQKSYISDAERTKREKARIEKLIAKTEEKISETEKAVAEADIELIANATDFRKCAEISARRETQIANLEQMLEEWTSLHRQLEELGA